MELSPSVLILGTERSGSTWLANIFDSHPGVEFLMEPFADYIELFPQIPRRNIYMSEITDEIAHTIRRQFQNLLKIKYPLFYKPGRPIFLKKLDRNLLRKFSRYLNLSSDFRLDRYEALNLNTLKVPYVMQTRKRTDQPVIAMKELRLNFKIPLLRQTFPHLKYLVTVRHPGAQISSILKWFQKGNLGELRKNLKTFVNDIQEQRRFLKYKHLISSIPWEDDPGWLLVLWWVIVNDVLFEDLKAYDLPYQAIHHAEFCETPLATVEKILSFCCLETTREVQSFVHYSSSEESDPNSHPVNTVRQSASYYHETLRAVDKELLHKISSVFSLFEPATELHHYYDKIRMG